MGPGVQPGVHQWQVQIRRLQRHAREFIKREVIISVYWG